MVNNAMLGVYPDAGPQPRFARQHSNVDFGGAAILSVTGNDREYQQLEGMLRGGCILHRATSLAGVHAELGKRECAVVLWDDDSVRDGWRTLANARTGSRRSPSLIVTSRLADAGLWAEALNLGAWDVLAKPFEEQEVARVMNMALAHWDTRAAAASAGD